MIRLHFGEHSPRTVREFAPLLRNANSVMIECDHSTDLANKVGEYSSGKISITKLRANYYSEVMDDITSMTAQDGFVGGTSVTRRALEREGYAAGNFDSALFRAIGLEQQRRIAARLPILRVVYEPPHKLFAEDLKHAQALARIGYAIEKPNVKFEKVAQFVRDYLAVKVRHLRDRDETIAETLKQLSAEGDVASHLGSVHGPVLAFLRQKQSPAESNKGYLSSFHFFVKAVTDIQKKRRVSDFDAVRLLFVMHTDQRALRGFYGDTREAMQKISSVIRTKSDSEVRDFWERLRGKNLDVADELENWLGLRRIS